MVRSSIQCFLVVSFMTTILATQLIAKYSALQPVNTSSPQETFKTFMDAMNEYKKGLGTGDKKQMGRIEVAVRTLDLEFLPPVLHREKGRQAAVFLKEVIDRLEGVDPDSMPTTDEVSLYRVGGTDIVIQKKVEGSRATEFLFSQSTVTRADDFYQAVKELPYQPGSGGGASYKEPWVEKHIPLWSKREFLGLLNWQWIGIFLAIFLGLFAKKIAHLLLKNFRKLLEKSAFIHWDEKVLEALEPAGGLFVASTFWFFAINVLQLEGVPLQMLTFVVQVLFSYSIIWALYRVSDLLTVYLRYFAAKSDSPLDDQLVPLLSKALRLFIVVFGVLIAIQNLGVNVMSLIAGLGLGGLAFALAAKDTAANLFGSITILWDKPFKVGDWIILDAIEGTVEEIGFRSTRIRTFYDSQVSIPNANMANANVDNMGRRKYRRVKTTLGITYNTPSDKLEAFLEGIKQIILANPDTRKDYFHVVFSGYGSSSLDILLYFFLKVPDWPRELVGRQNVFLEILRLAESLGVSFAFPSTSLYVEQAAPDPTQDHRTGEALKTQALEFGKGGKLSNPNGLGIFDPPY